MGAENDLGSTLEGVGIENLGRSRVSKICRDHLAKRVEREIQAEERAHDKDKEVRQARCILGTSGWFQMVRAN